MSSEQLRDLMTWLLAFWAGAFVVIWLIGRRVFREQIHELRTLRMMRDKIGPMYRDFDPLTVNTWVDRASPHVWTGWATGDMSSLAEHMTEAFRAAPTMIADVEGGQIHEAKLDRVLKVHPLGLHMVGDGPPPGDTELVLRIETKAVDCIRDAFGNVVDGKPETRQVQHIWTLRHDGDRWRLHALRRAESEIKDLVERPQVPPLEAWKRPEDEPREEPDP